MNLKERFYPESRFGGFTDIDGTMAFFTRVNALLESSFTVLDVGCGRGEYAGDPVGIRRKLRIIRGKVAKTVGIDVDEGARENPFVDEFHLIRGDSWPTGDDTADLIICDHVMEHVQDPEQFFGEARRVLRDGGYLCIRTPNRWSYIGISARIIPNTHHAKVLGHVQDGRREEDVFPTVYRCNSIRKVRAMMRKQGFESVVYGYEPEPSYLSFWVTAYWLGVVYQRFAPRFLKSTLFAFGRVKKSSS